MQTNDWTLRLGTLDLVVCVRASMRVCVHACVQTPPAPRSCFGGGVVCVQSKRRGAAAVETSRIVQLEWPATIWWPKLTDKYINIHGIIILVVPVYAMPL